MILVRGCLVYIMKTNYSKLKPGLSGLMRIKNEASFIENCVNSCISALDELIIVYNDCTDDTPVIVEKMRKQYPDKIKAYAYNHHILSHNLSEEEFEIAVNLPDDSPRLHCNQCNYALSKVSYKYAVKIDADQLYFADELQKWRDICSKDILIKWNIGFILGWLFMMYISVYRRLSTKCGKPCLWMLPDWLVRFFTNSYLNYAKWRLQRGTAVISLSGFNVFKDEKWYVLFDGVNIHPPYNGEGDHLIFRVSNQTYFYKLINPLAKVVIEGFHCPYKSMIASPVWFHLHANREYCWDKVKAMKDAYPECFVPIEDFPEMSYKEVHDKMDKKAHSLFQRTLFALIHKLGKSVLKNHIDMLK